MALDESTDGLEKLESNGVEAWIDPRLKEAISQLGEISIDYIERDWGPSGYSISVGTCGDCSSGGCG